MGTFLGLVLGHRITILNILYTLLWHFVCAIQCAPLKIMIPQPDAGISVLRPKNVILHLPAHLDPMLRYFCILSYISFESSVHWLPFAPKFIL